jgi:hypothetical protein
MPTQQITPPSPHHQCADAGAGSTYYTYITYTNYGQVHQDLGLADHVWQDKRAAIAKTVDELGDQLRPAMRAGWLSYIRHGQCHPCCWPTRDAGHLGAPRLSRLCFCLLLTLIPCDGECL